MHLIGALFHPLVAGILLAAILAAIMSTADSQLLVAAAAVSNDTYRLGLRPDAPATELVWVGRLAVLVIAAVAAWMALTPGSRVLELVGHAWAGFGATFGPVLLLALYWRGLTGSGALAGMLVGGVTVIVWSRLEGGWFDLYELLPGFLFAATAAVLVSRLDAMRGPETA